MNHSFKCIGWFYDSVRAVLFILYKLLFRFRFSGSEKVPAARDPRGVILAPNHASFLDPPILGVSLKRRVTFFAKEYLFRAPVVGWTLRSIGAVPIKTQADDFRSIRDVIRLLKTGKCLAVFPEGTRSENGEMKDAEPGLGFLALKSGAWVVPAYIGGTYAAFPKGVKFPRLGRPVSIRYGEPFIPAEDPEITGAPDPYAAVGTKIMARIRALKAEEEAKRKV